MNFLDSLQALTSAIHSGSTELLEQYLQHGGDPNADYGMTLLGISSQQYTCDAIQAVHCYYDYCYFIFKLPWYSIGVPR